MAVAQEVHHGHFHLGPIGGTKPTPPTDVEVEAKVAEAENASVSWKRHVTSKGTAWDAHSPEIYTFISVTKVLQAFNCTTGCLLFCCFCGVVSCEWRGFKGVRCPLFLLSFVSNLVNFYDSTVYIYIFRFIYLDLKYTISYHIIISYHFIWWRSAKKNMFLMCHLSSKVSLTLLGVLALAWQSMVNRTGDWGSFQKISHRDTGLAQISWGLGNFGMQTSQVNSQSPQASNEGTKLTKVVVLN